MTVKKLTPFVFAGCIPETIAHQWNQDLNHITPGKNGRLTKHNVDGNQLRLAENQLGI